MKIRMVAVALAAQLLGLGSATLGHAADAPLVGNAEAGAPKSAVCGACHGPTGNSPNPEWPNLAGQHHEYIAEQLALLKSGARVAPVMNPMAAMLSPQDMADLAAYFEKQTLTGLEADAKLAETGEKLYRGGDAARGIPACMACHGPAGRGNEAAKMPALRGQQSVYVSKQLHDYASGQRGTGPNEVMQTISKRLSEDDMRNLAAYVQGIR